MILLFHYHKFQIYKGNNYYINSEYLYRKFHIQILSRQSMFYLNFKKINKFLIY